MGSESSSGRAQFAPPPTSPAGTIVSAVRGTGGGDRRAVRLEPPGRQVPAGDLQRLFERHPGQDRRQRPDVRPASSADHSTGAATPCSNPAAAALHALPSAPRGHHQRLQRFKVRHDRRRQPSHRWGNPSLSGGGTGGGTASEWLRYHPPPAALRAHATRYCRNPPRATAPPEPNSYTGTTMKCAEGDLTSQRVEQAPFPTGRASSTPASEARGAIRHWQVSPVVAPVGVRFIAPVGGGIFLCSIHRGSGLAEVHPPGDLAVAFPVRLLVRDDRVRHRRLDVAGGVGRPRGDGVLPGCRVRPR